MYFRLNGGWNNIHFLHHSMLIFPRHQYFHESISVLISNLWKIDQLTFLRNGMRANNDIKIQLIIIYFLLYLSFDKVFHEMKFCHNLCHPSYGLGSAGVVLFSLHNSTCHIIKRHISHKFCESFYVEWIYYENNWYNYSDYYCYIIKMKGIY